MITEPELTGDSTGDHLPRPRTAEAAAEADIEGAELADVVGGLGPRADTRPWRRPPWLWGALAGAAAASAIWAGPALAGAPHHASPPDLHGYRIGYSPCSGRPFDALITAVGAATTGTAPASFAHGPAVDRARCTFTAGAVPEHDWATVYVVETSVDLHKLADPRAEFEDERALDTTSLTVADSTIEVPHLGDDAYALSFGDETQILKVLRGGAVVTLRLTAATRWVGPGASPAPGDLVSDTPLPPRTPDLSHFGPALTTAARTVLTALSDQGMADQGRADEGRAGQGTDR